MAHASRIAILLALSLATACSRKDGAAPASRPPDPPVGSAAVQDANSPPTKPVAAGTLQVGPRPIELAVYLAASPSAALVTSTRNAVRARFPGIALKNDAADKGPMPSVLVAAPPIDQAPPPTLEQLRYFGRSLDAAEASAAAASKGVLILAFALDADPANARLREAQKLALEIAKKSGGFVWDDTARQLYSTAVWEQERVQGWDGDRPDVRRHITIHHYEVTSGRHRAITLGMVKFGLPDLVLQDLPLSEGAAMTTIVDAVAQVLVEGAAVGPGGVLDLDLRSVHHPGAREAIVGSTMPGAKLRGRIALVVALPEEGDPDNRLLELTFPSFAGASEAERQADAIATLVGTEQDPAARAPADDQELAAVTARVQRRLPAVGAAFRAGLPVGVVGPGTRDHERGRRERRDSPAT